MRLRRNNLELFSMVSTLQPRGCHRVIIQLRGVTFFDMVKNRQKLNFYDPGDEDPPSIGAIEAPRW